MKKILTIAIAIVSATGITGAAYAQSVSTTATSTVNSSSSSTSSSLQNLLISPQTLPDATNGVAYSENLTASSPTLSGPYNFSITSGGLPPGLALYNASNTTVATLSGTPSGSGPYNFALTITNGSSSETQGYAININNTPTTTGTTAASSTATTTITTTTVTTGVPSTTSATVSSTIDLQNELNSLMAQLTYLQNELATATTGTTGTGSTAIGSGIPVGAAFERDLTIGSSGADVMALQKFLNSNGAQVAASGPGSPGEETDYFGPLTRAALATWQSANGVSPAQGYYGAITRAKIGSMLMSETGSSVNANSSGSSTSGAASAPMIPAPSSTTTMTVTSTSMTTTSSTSY